MDAGMTKRRNFADKFTAAVALEALRGDKTVQEIAAERSCTLVQVSTWKRQAIEGIAGGISDKAGRLEQGRRDRRPAGQDWPACGGKGVCCHTDRSDELV